MFLAVFVFFNKNEIVYRKLIFISDSVHKHMIEYKMTICSEENLMKFTIPKKLQSLEIPKFSEIQKLPKKKLVSIIAVLLVLVVLIVSGVSSCIKGGNEADVMELEPYTVARGDITVSVTGSGTVAPIEQYEIQSIVTGDILEDYVTVGKEVQKDDILYVIDSSSAENNLERAESSYEQQLISHNKKVDDFNEAEEAKSIYASTDGVIKELYVKNGDSVNVGTKLFEIENTTYLTVNIPFIAGNAKNIYENQTATIYFEERNESHTGYVSHVATGTYVTGAGAIVSDVEITFKNPGAIVAGEQVTATIGSYACNDYGTVNPSTTKVVTAEVSGDITNLRYSKGDSVASGRLIMNISNDSSYDDLRSSELSLKNSKLSLDDQVEKLDDYTIRSSISGTIISKTMKQGDTLDGNKSSLAIVADMSKLTFDISVDELYIKDINVGQTVSVTADAIPGQRFEGVVDTVSIIGTPVNGVTVYPVTVVISEYEGLLPGMNVDAEIVISNAKDVLTVPVNAVSRGNLVLVKNNSNVEGIAPAEEKNDKNGARMSEAPKGYKYTMVETGVANDDYVEIVSGLSEGDEIYISVIKNTQTSQVGFGMGGGMTGGMGGMPSGGRMPSGGMPSGGGMR